MTLQQSLPPNNDITAFLASNQTAISQLADQYCNLAVNSPAPGGLFSGLNLSTQPLSYFQSSTNVTSFINAITSAAIPTDSNGSSNPANVTAVTNELQNNLIPKLVGTPAAGRTTATIAQAACTATLGSAVVSLQ
jgi:hypothetical protein